MLTHESAFDSPRRRRIKRLSAQAILISVFCGGLSYAIYRTMTPGDFHLRPIVWPADAKWIAAEGRENYSAFFRKEFQIQGRVARAWVLVAPHEGFELTINGDSVSRWNLWRPTRPFQTGVQEFGQRIQRHLATLALNFPREYQWTGHRNGAIPIYIDVTPFLKRGLNVVCFEVQARKAPACIRFAGGIELESGKRLPLSSDTSFKACDVPRGLLYFDWCDRNVRRIDWSPAVAVAGPAGTNWSHVPQDCFSRPFHGEWLFVPQRRWDVGGRDPTSRRPVNYFFRSQWNLEDRVKQAYIRVLSNRPFYIFVNGQFCDPCVPYAKSRTGGEWMINAQPPSPRSRANVLDPDEVASLYVGTRFENPRHGDPTVNDFKQFVNTMNRTKERPMQNRSATPAGSYADKRGTIIDDPLRSPIEAPDRLIPKSLTKNVEQVDFKIYGLANLLQAGTNEIVIKALDDPIRDGRRLGAPRLACDMRAIDKEGPSDWQSGSGWTVHVGDPNADPLPAAEYVPPAQLPQAHFWGHAQVPRHENLRLASYAIGLSLTFLFALMTVARILRFPWSSHAYVLLPSAALLACVLLLQTTLKEQQECVYFLMPENWRCLVSICVLLPIFGLVHRAVQHLFPHASPQLQWPKSGPIRWLQDRPQVRWMLLVYAMVFVCGLLRAYKLDFQTLDDDEYASVQAAMAIAETGAPHFVGNIYYTRSPLHHYYAGALVWMFGSSIWVLRMGQIVLAMGTCLMIYIASKEILGSRWVGIGGMLLFSIHPFLLFSAHVARFYQQQQFFALLVVYFYYWGFVESNPRCRYWTLASFLAAILSQETSAVLGLSMGICFLIFCRNIKTSGIIKCAIVGACVIAILVVDVLAFQSNCLTRTEGISPNVEAAVKPNFTWALNLLSIFVTYARLHVALSFFVIVGVLVALYQKDRNTLYIATMCATGIAFAVTFITGVSLRYQFWVFAPWIMMGMHGIRCVVRLIDRWIEIPTYSLASPRILGLVLTLMVAASFSPWRIPGSYDTKLLGNASGALQWVRANMRAGDAVATTEPHPHAARIETGESTFDISFPLLYDFTYKDPQGYLRDRNANALVLPNIAALQWATANYDRIWFCLNREKFRSRNRNIRWEYPSARAELFLRRNCELKHQDYVWSVFLWDKSTGQFSGFRRELP